MNRLLFVLYYTVNEEEHGKLVKGIEDWTAVTFFKTYLVAL